MQALHGIHQGNILLDGFIEESHSWELEKNLESGSVPRREPWIGFLHNPPNMPAWYYWQDSPQALLSRIATKQSLKHCKGILALSEYMAEWVLENTGLPCSVLKHPGEIPALKFSPEDYFGNPKRKIIQIGYWLRRLFSIQFLPTDKFEKIWLVTKPSAVQFRDTVEISYQDSGRVPVGSYREMGWVEHDTYDELLTCNLAFVHYYDASASNAILDCIARSTPILVNPLPAVIEYLGEDYPFYFQSLEEAAVKAENDSLVKKTYAYLESMNKDFLQQEEFRQTFIQSEVFRDCLKTG